MPLGPEDADAEGLLLSEDPVGLLEALLDAIHTEDGLVGGRGVTVLTAPLAADSVDCIEVESTIGFGELNDGTGDARVLIGGEVIDAATRNNNTPFGFETLTRGDEPQLHPAGSLVIDLSRNRAALDYLRRGFFVETAVGEDLQRLGRNLGLERCPGTTEAQQRSIIQGVAYLPKNPRLAIEAALEALFEGDTSRYTVTERLVSDRWTIYVSVAPELGDSLLGRFVLNGGERSVMLNATQTGVASPIVRVLGVYADTPAARRGKRDGLTNYFTAGGGGSFAGQQITLGASPGPLGTQVIVDYTAREAHYLAADETVRQNTTPDDQWAYLADPLLAARCLLEQIRPAGTRIILTSE
jgi:hypothetical protein